MLLISLIPAFFIAPNSGTPLSTQHETGLVIHNAKHRLSLSEPTSQVIRTYESWCETFYVGVNASSTIFANYSDQWLPGISFRVCTDETKIGCPELLFRYAKGNGVGSTRVFTIPVDICNTGKRHVAFTLSDTEVKGYLDGELVKDWPFDGTFPKVDIPFSVGGDESPANVSWFRGSIHSLSLYDSVRSDAQIKEDMGQKVKFGKHLIAGWNFDDSMHNVVGGSNELMAHFYNKDFTPRDSYDYTFAVVGDTQSLIYRHPEEFHAIYDCLLEKKDEMNIQLVMGLGDIVEMNKDYEWLLARQEILRLSGKIPFTLVRGNHDICDYGGVSEQWRDLKYGQYFDCDTYRAELSGFYNGSIENAYKTFSVEGTDYLLLLLDYGPSDEILAWADRVVEAFPNHRVIVNTHAFLFRDGTTLDGTDLVPPMSQWGKNNGNHIWEKFAKKHSNIIMILSGHDPHPEIVRTPLVGDKGNIVNALLIDPQDIDYHYGPTGMIAFFHFSHGGQEVNVEYYSSILHAFYKPLNQFSFTLGGEEISSTGESQNALYGAFCEAKEISEGDEIAIAYRSDDESRSLSFSSGAISSIKDEWEGNSLAFHGERLVFCVEGAEDGWLLKTPSGKALAYDTVGKLFLNEEGSRFVFEKDGTGFRVISGEKCLSYKEGFFMGDEAQKIAVFVFQSVFVDKEGNVLRYLKRLDELLTYVFDMPNDEAERVYAVAKDDYERLDGETKTSLQTLIAGSDARVTKTIEKYTRAVLVHDGVSGFEDFLHAVPSLPWHVKFYNTYFWPIFISALSVLGVAVATIIIFKVHKKRHRKLNP